jgi:hypothetical protein
VAGGGWALGGGVRGLRRSSGRNRLTLGEQQGGAGLDGAGGTLVEDAQEHEGDQGDVDLYAHGIFAASQKATDLEVLLEPFEQQLDLPALLVELPL